MEPYLVYHKENEDGSFTREFQESQKLWAEKLKGELTAAFAESVEVTDLAVEKQAPFLLWVEVDESKADEVQEFVESQNGKMFPAEYWNPSQGGGGLHGPWI